MDHLPLMARFSAWVNRRLYQSVALLSDDAFRADRGAYFGSVHQTLNHLLVVDRLWLGRIEGRQHGIERLDQILYDDVGALGAACEAEDRRLVGIVDDLDETRLSEPVTYERIIGTGRETVRTDHVLITLLNHRTHHRGQIHAMLTQAGVEPAPWDVVFYLEGVGLAGPAEG